EGAPRRRARGRGARECRCRARARGARRHGARAGRRRGLARRVEEVRGGPGRQGALGRSRAGEGAMTMPTMKRLAAALVLLSLPAVARAEGPPSRWERAKDPEKIEDYRLHRSVQRTFPLVEEMRRHRTDLYDRIA